MSKDSLYLVVVIALAVTAVTFFISGQSASRTCSPADIDAGTGSITDTSKLASDAPTEAKAVTRGFPLWYYQEPFPANCIATSNVSSLGGLNMDHLGADLLSWLLALLAVVLAMAGFKAWRGPAMLGDNARRG